MRHVLDRAAHRPWQLPASPWIMAQSWHDLLFAHWRAEAGALRPHIPAPLEIDKFDGSAWIGIVPFRMTGVRLRCTPALPGISAFPELNVRTYVTVGGKPGVWFFSLDAANAVAVTIARAWFHLPYFRARMNCEEKEGWFHYQSKRIHRDAPDAVLEARYRPVGKIFEAQRGTLEHFLTERYCLYSASPRGRVYRGEIHHPAWKLQAGEAEFAQNSMAAAARVPLPSAPPVLHVSQRQDMVAWAPQRLP